MFEIDRIPAQIYAVLADKGVRTEDILLAAYCDRDRNHTPCDTYLFATAGELLVLSGLFSVRRTRAAAALLKFGE